MIRRCAATLLLATLGALVLSSPAGAATDCPEKFKSECFEIEPESLSASLSTTQAGAHPDATLAFRIATDSASKPDTKGLHDGFAPTRNVRTDIPPGLIGNPDVLGVPQQCRAAELTLGECPNGSQIGLVRVSLYKLERDFVEPVYMMAPPGGEVIARIGFVPGLVGASLYADATVRSESDYGLSVEIIDAPNLYTLVESEVTLWGVPASEVHDRERCTPIEVYDKGCTETAEDRPPGSRELPFLTNPTRCSVPFQISVSAASWIEPRRFDTKTASFPEVNGCNKLFFGPGLSVQPTSHRAASPTGLDMTLTQPETKDVNQLEPSQLRDMRIALPRGMMVNPAAAAGQDVCTVTQVHYKERVAAECPDASKVASTEFEIGGLPRRMKGAIYLREPEPGNLFRVWAVADDLGAHVKLPAQLQIDEATGQITSVLLEAPQAPLREVRLLLKSGFRAPLATPESCGTYQTHYDFTPWSGGPHAIADTQMQIDEGCETGGFSPTLSAGSTNSAGGAHSPFTFTLVREDGEQNLASLDVTLPRGMSATFAGIPRCEGAAAETGQCPAASRIGRITASTGVGRQPLWVPQPGKRPTAVYLAGPYKGAPLSIVAVVPAQAGPFDLGDQVVRSAIYVDPVTAEATTKSDPLPQMLEGVPVLYRTVNVLLDRNDFSLNPTSCARKETKSILRSVGGKEATPSSPFAATGCGRLAFKPKLNLRLHGGTHRGAHPSLRAVLKMPAGGANIAKTSVALPHSEFLDQAHIKTVCTRVQFAAEQCPPGSIYGHVKAITPLLDEPVEGDVYLRSSSNTLPDMVFALEGPPSLPIKIHAAGRIDSVNGGIRSTFESVPDAPLTELVVSFPGGKKGLIVNSTNLCEGTHRATAKFTAQNGKRANLHPVLKSKCPRK